jgi:diguanylate cyclase (GGDEF)-like protein
VNWRVLIEIGRRVRAVTRATDLVARYAGDEFVVMLDAADSTEMAELVRAKVERALSQPLPCADATIADLIDISGSVGLAIFSEDESAEALVRRADAEMYRFKSLSKMRPRTSDLQAA